MTDPLPAGGTTGADAAVRPRFWNVPNTLTLGRLVLGAGFLAGVAHGRYVAALVLFGLAALTDALDGYFARLLDQATPIGRQLDPLVDKLLVAGGLIYLVAIPGTGLAPWMVTAVVARELLIQWVRSLLEGRGEAFGAQWSGKLKTGCQCAAIVAILLTLAAGAAPAWLVLARDATIWLAVGLTLYSGAAYLVDAWPRLRADLP